MGWGSKEKAKEYQRAYYERNKERIAKRSREYYLAHKEEGRMARGLYYKANQKKRDLINNKWAKDHPEETRKIARKSRLKLEFGMTVEEYDALLEFQKGVCKLCGVAPTAKRLAVDHCHETGRIRGLLCFMCNRNLIGLIERKGINPEEIVNYMRTE